MPTLRLAYAEISEFSIDQSCTNRARGLDLSVAGLSVQSVSLRIAYIFKL